MWRLRWTSQRIVAAFPFRHITVIWAGTVSSWPLAETIVFHRAAAGRRCHAWHVPLNQLRSSTACWARGGAGRA